MKTNLKIFRNSIFQMQSILGNGILAVIFVINLNKHFITFQFTKLSLHRTVDEHTEHFIK